MKKIIFILLCLIIYLNFFTFDINASSTTTTIPRVSFRCNDVDLDHNGIINIIDIAIVAKAYGSYPGHPKWNTIADLDKNGVVNITDVAIVAKEFGKKCFRQSEVLYDISEETGKPDQYYCSYDETRNKVTIIIKENGIYDNQELINIFNQYFNSVKSHLNIDSAGVKKFHGSTINEFDKFIEDLVKSEYVGYIIFVGTDLPIVINEYNDKTGDIERSNLDHPTINDVYAYVERTKEVGVNECVDVAISTVIAPEKYSDEDKRSFVKQVFSNFIKYHSNIQATFDKFNKNILIIEHYEFASESISYNPANFDSYNTIYFYNPIYVINTEYSKVESEMKNKPLILMYHTHGSANYLGMGLNNKIYVSNQEILDFYNSNGQISLFSDVLSACGQNWLSDKAYDFCCWPQTWLKTGVWTVFDVTGDPYHHSFERWLFNEKIVGNALRKTYHVQDMIYGDILATLP